MNIERVQKQLEIDEGVVYEIYHDHLGYATFGIGHLVRETDPENGFALGHAVEPERVQEAFETDLTVACEECSILYPTWHTFPEEVQEILVNMMFNLGRPRLGKFKKNEILSIKNSLPLIYDSILCFVNEGIDSTMNKFN